MKYPQIEFMGIFVENWHACCCPSIRKVIWGKWKSFLVDCNFFPIETFSKLAPPPFQQSLYFN